MGFFDKFIGKQEQAPKIEKINYSGIPDLIAHKKAELTESHDPKPPELHAEILSVSEALKAKLEELSNSDVQKDVQQRIKSMVSSSRDNYVAKIRTILKKIEREQSVFELSEKLPWALDEIKKIDLKYGERASFGYPKTQEVKKELNRLVSLSKELNDLLDSKKEQIKAANKAKRIYNGIEKMRDDMGQRGDKKSDTEAELRDLNNSKKELEKKIENMERSQRAEKANEIKVELVELEKKKVELETFVLNVLGPLKRIFKKYAKAVSEGKASGINIDRYAEDPVQTYLRGENTLPDILAKIQKAIQTGVVDMGSGEEGKALKKIRAISFSYLEKSRSEYNETVLRIRSLEVRLAELSISKEVEKLQAQIESLDNKINTISKNINRTEENIEEQGVEIEEERKKLEVCLSDLLKKRCEVLWDVT